jgi:hypothetical protein
LQTAIERDKETQLTARTFILTAGAVFVLAAPAAQANLERILPAKTQFAAHHKVVTKHHKVAAKHSTTKRKASSGPLYIYFPGTPNQASSASSQGDCTLGDNCTDEQLCDIWGMNCDLVVSVTTNTSPPAESTQIESTPSTDQSTPAPVENSASDVNSLNCPSGGVWDEDHQYCV